MEIIVIYKNPDGTLSSVVSAPQSKATVKDLIKSVPVGCDFSVVSRDELPKEGTFRGAWVYRNKKCEIDLPKAKEIAHGRRRESRSLEFIPLDIKATIPPSILFEGTPIAELAEIARQSVRGKYAVMQTAMDNATTVEELKELLP